MQQRPIQFVLQGNVIKWRCYGELYNMVIDRKLLTCFSNAICIDNLVTNKQNQNRYFLQLWLEAKSQMAWELLGIYRSFGFLGTNQTEVD